MRMEALTLWAPDNPKENPPRWLRLLGRLKTRPHNQQTFITGHIATSILYTFSLIPHTMQGRFLSFSPFHRWRHCSLENSTHLKHYHALGVPPLRTEHHLSPREHTNQNGPQGPPASPSLPLPRLPGLWWDGGKTDNPHLPSLTKLPWPHSAVGRNVFEFWIPALLFMPAGPWHIP